MRPALRFGLLAKSAIHAAEPDPEAAGNGGLVPPLDTYPGWQVPNPISVEVLRGSAPLGSVLADVLALTNLNYNSSGFGATLPVTLGFANGVGEILMAAPEGDEPIPQLPFRYYI